jgi:hypothetical protein
LDAVIESNVIEQVATVKLLRSMSETMRIVYIIVLVCVKLSIGLLLLAILGTTSRRILVACWATLAASLGWGIYATVVCVVPTLPQKNLVAVYAIDIGTDLILLILPLEIFKGLHMPWAHRIPLLLMFSGGVVYVTRLRIIHIRFSRYGSLPLIYLF